MNQLDHSFDELEKLLNDKGLLTRTEQQKLKKKELQKELSVRRGEVLQKDSESSPQALLQENVLVRASLDQRIQIQVSPDAMSAFLTMFPGDEEITRLKISQKFEACAIRYGVDWELVDQLIDEVNQGMPVVSYEIAVGKKAKNGVSAEVVYYFERKRMLPKINLAGAEETVDRVNYKSCFRINMVADGTLLAEKTTVVEGVDGINVRGEMIRALPANDCKLLAGNNTKMIGYQIFATASGRPEIKQGHVCVVTEYRVDGDVNLNTGNLKFNGDIEITGNVASGFVVESGGNIVIGGSVDAARIVASGSIAIRGGFSGSDRGVLKAGEDIFVGPCNSGKIECKKDLWVDKQLLNCEVNCSGNLYCNGEKASVIGGTITVGQEMEVMNLGSQMGVATKVNLGNYQLILREISYLQAELKKRQEQIKMIQSVSWRLNEKIKRKEGNDADQELIDKLAVNLNELNDDFERMTRIKFDLEKQRQEFKSHFLRVIGVCWPSVKIEIRGLIHEVHTMLQGVEFYVDPVTLEFKKRTILKKKAQQRKKGLLNFFKIFTE